MMMFWHPTNPTGVWRNGRRCGLRKVSLDREILQV